MLIDNNELMSALVDFPLRNEIIEEYANVSSDDKEYYFKWILAFFLGSNVTLMKIIDSQFIFQDKYSLKCVFSSYYCLLLLDKKLSLLPKNSPLYWTLQKLQRDIFTCYNYNYLMLKTNAFLFLLKLQLLILPTTSRSEMLKNIQSNCLAELNYAESKDIQAFYQPSDASADVSNAFPTFFKKLKNINVVRCAMTTGHVPSYPFYQEVEDSVYSSYKVLIHRPGHPIIDGLFIKYPNSKDNNIVLALVGHFPSERDYIAKMREKFLQLFSCDTVFINHRNYCSRSNKYAETLFDLANDVVAFVHYYRKKNKNIILYGMCGGAAHMILAANILNQKNIPYKIIIDRFFTRYNNCADFKTNVRALQSEKKCILQRNATFFLKASDLGKMYFFFIIFILFASLVKKIMVSDVNRDFSQDVLAIPQEDVLILQAKSKKTTTAGIAGPADYFIHPQNDMRYALKESRKKNKNVLKNIMGYCDLMIEIYRNKTMHQILLDLKNEFKKSIELIDNEKLTTDFPYTINQGICIHSHYLFDLKTRHNLPTKQFVTGFFKKPFNDCSTFLKEIISHAHERIFDAIDLMQPEEAKGITDKSRLANTFILFLRELKDNEKFIIHMLNRVASSGLGKPTDALKNFLNSYFFQVITFKKYRINRIYI